jgi:plastocyanin
VTLVSISALSFALVAACGGDDDDDDGGGNTPAATATDEPEATDTPAAESTDTPEAEATDTAAPDPTDTPDPSAPIEVTASNFNFSPSRIQIGAGVETTIQMTNQDDGIPHSFHVMAGDVDEATPTFTPDDGPMSITFTVDTPGNYTFACDVHPTMQGALVVE